ncbi:hypothetical protein [Mesorhizobium sp. M0254]|uniref:hypothetical protein n=1 Tax=Mesorhizobium sp. M0254 TaxID=2956927 RepID=UPI00333B6D5A
MTVPSDTNRSGPYNGNGVTTVFDYEFRVVNENHIKVIKANAAGVETILTIDADYIVSDVGNPAGGQVALTVALPTGQTLTLLRNVPFTQETDLQNQGAYYAETIEAAFDLAAMRDQELQEQIDRAVLIPASEDPAQLDGLIGDILRLADSADEIDIVAGVAAQVTTVASNIGSVNTAAANIAAIIAAPGAAASAQAAYDATVAAIAALGNPLVFKGAWDASAGTFPGGGAAKAGWQYVVSVPGTVGGVVFELNDMIVATVNNASTAVYAANWYKLESDLVQSVAGLTGVITAAGLRDALDVPVYVLTRAAMAGLDQTKDIRAVLDGVIWVWSASNLSALVTADPRQAYYVAPTAAPTGASGAWVKQREDLDCNIRDFGAMQDGATDDKAACQAALNFIKTQGGGVFKVPASLSVTKLLTGLVYDVSAVVGRFTSRLTIKGDGPGASVLSLLGVAATALAISGNPAYPEMHAHFEGIRITGSNTVGSKGLALSVSAFGTSDGLVIEAFDYCMDCTDVEQTAFMNSNFRWGLHGVRFNAAAGTTSANSLLFVNCAIANNTTWGAWFTNPNAVKFIGGSIQYNGATGGGATNWGLKITESGDGYGNVVLDSVALEGNGGDADFIGEQTTNVCTYAFLNCGFARPNSASYATNFIKLDGSQAITVHLSGNTFRGYNTYVANAARPYVAVNNTAVKIFDDGTNIYGSATERPGWATFNMFIKRGVADQNLYVSNGFTRSTGMAIGAINDALTGLAPFEIRTSELLVSGLAGGTAVRTVASYLKGTVVYDPPSLADGAGVTTTVTVTGAALGDVAQASHTQPLQGITVNAWVSAADTVSVRFQNESGGVLDLASGTLTAIVIKP